MLRKILWALLLCLSTNIWALENHALNRNAFYIQGGYSFVPQEYAKSSYFLIEDIIYLKYKRSHEANFSLGYTFMNSTRAELEFSYIWIDPYVASEVDENDPKVIGFLHTITSNPAELRRRAIIASLNKYYDFFMGSYLNFYASYGVGFGRVVKLAGDKKSAMSLGFRAGINLSVTENIAIGGGYRYVMLLTYEPNKTVSSRSIHKLGANAIEAGLTFVF